MPNPQDYDKTTSRVWLWPEAKIKAVVQRDPTNAHGDGYLVFPLSLTVFDQDNRHILTVALQQTDFRMLAFMTGEKLKDLKGDKKGYLSPINVGIYRPQKYEEFDLFEEIDSTEEMVSTLLELVSDELDLWEEPVVSNFSAFA